MGNDLNIVNTRIELNTILALDSVPRIMWCFWYGGPMNENRVRSFELMKKYMEVPICLVTRSNIHEFILPEYPLHQAFDYLSDVHKSDYFRIYLLHLYGGGWHDIKPTMVSYKVAWDEFEDPEVYFVGKPEIKGGPAKVYDSDRRWMPHFWQDLVATNRWIARANTPFSWELFDSVNQLLDENLQFLKETPARHPYDKKREGIINRIVYGKRQYPLPWTVFGNLFHPLNYKYRKNVRRTLPADQIENLGLPYR